MNSNHKPGFFPRICLVLIFLLTAGSFIVSNSSPVYADDEKESVEMTQSTDDEKMTEEMAQKIKELEVITIENKGYKKDRKGPAKLEHVKHARDYKISCWECHHEYKDEQQNEQSVQTVKTEQKEETEGIEGTEGTEGSEQMVENEQPLPKELTDQNIWSPWGITKKCAECHDPQEKKNDVIKLQAAYHKNCKTCHLERRIYGNDILAYRKCTSCHE